MNIISSQASQVGIRRQSSVIIIPMRGTNHKNGQPKLVIYKAKWILFCPDRLSATRYATDHIILFTYESQESGRIIIQIWCSIKIQPRQPTDLTRVLLSLTFSGSARRSSNRLLIVNQGCSLLEYIQPLFQNKGRSSYLFDRCEPKSNTNNVAGFICCWVEKVFICHQSNRSSKPKILIRLVISMPKTTAKAVVCLTILMI